MRWLISPPPESRRTAYRMWFYRHWPERARGDRGAAATLVAVLLAGGVVLGMLTVSVDVGNIMWERRQLQNGADATSTALAAICANDPTKCNPTTTVSQLAPLADANSADGTQQFATRPDTVQGQCARFPNAVGMPGCASATTDADISKLQECPPVPTWLRTGNGTTVNYVETYTRTRSTAADNTILPSFFAKAITGADTTSVSACARAAWGPAGPTSSKVMPLVISECDWQAQTGWTPTGTAAFPPAPSGAWPGYDNASRPWPATERAIYSKGNPTTCNTSSPGGTAPGGFAWLDTIPQTSCLAQVTNGWAHGSTGASAECSNADLMPFYGKVVLVPMFDCITAAPTTITSATDCNSGNGNNTYYHISGYAPFYLSGWWLNPNNKASVRPPNGYKCGNPNRCLFGWFTHAVVTDATIDTSSGSTPPYGAIAVQPAG